MLKIWEPFEDAPGGYEAISRRDAALLRDTASHLLEMLGYEDDEAATQILDRAQRVCRLAGVPIGHHFRPVFVHSPAGLHTDYLLTDFACYLITINADPAHPAVAQAQIYFLRKRG